MCFPKKNLLQPPVSFTSVSWLKKKILKRKEKRAFITYPICALWCWDLIAEIWFYNEKSPKEVCRCTVEIYWHSVLYLQEMYEHFLLFFLMAKNTKIKNKLVSLVKLLRKCPSGGWTMHMLKWYSAMHSPKIWERWLSLMISLSPFFFPPVKSVAFWIWNECCS